MIEVITVKQQMSGEPTSAAQTRSSGRNNLMEGVEPHGNNVRVDTAARKVQTD